MRSKSVGLAIAAIFVAFGQTPAVAQFAGGADGYSFIKAVRSRDGSKVMELLRARPNIVNARDDKGETGLMVAVSARDPDFTGFLLAQGADPNVAARDGDTALIKAARIGFVEAAGELVSRRVRVDAANRMGETALIIAVQQREPQLVKLLLTAGADPDKTDSAAGLSARGYAKRDPRARDILVLIEAATKKKAAPEKSPFGEATDFKIK